METKKQFRWFTIFQYEQEQDYLQEMHRSGWKFVKVTGFGMYHFEQCEPQDVVYRLDYNKEGLEHKGEYVKMFADCGWDYIQDYAGYSYFSKPVSETGEAEEIFCDEDSKLQMMERVIRGRMTPLLVIFMAVLVPQFVYSVTIYHNYALATFFGGILAVYGFVFIGCFLQYRRIKQRHGK